MNKSQIEIDDAIARMKNNNATQDDMNFFIGCTEFAIWLPKALKEKDISIKNLRRALCGESTSEKKRKKKNKNSDKDAKNNENTDSDKNADTASSENNEQPVNPPTEQNKNSNVVDIKTAKPKKPGHGRMGRDVYTNANKVFIPNDTLKSGDFCPEKCGGKVYIYGPGIVVRVTGNSFATVTEYNPERFRCNLCGFIVTAKLPDGVSETEKYDPKFKAQLAIQKYYAGMPFYRQENIQQMLGFPLPDSTQFDLVEQVADCAYPIISALEKIAANGTLSHYDDTGAKILSVIADNRANPDKKRTGMFTTGIISQINDVQKIALFYTGTKHAGENITALLQHRNKEIDKIILMCDALASNTPKSLRNIIIECNCLSHGFRKFRDLLEYYPEICLHVIHALGIIYENDEKTSNMTNNERLYFHRKHSKPIMKKLHKWLKKQINKKLVEPNGHLGGAVKYMLKHWEKLTRFLTVVGAPIDNNIVERSLKIAIRNRKNAMFYKTLHGATIGNILTSLIETTRLSSVNPVDYLVALQENKSAVHKNPADWVPWLYQKTLENMRLNQIKIAA